MWGARRTDGAPRSCAACATCAAWWLCLGAQGRRRQQGGGRAPKLAEQKPTCRIPDGVHGGVVGHVTERLAWLGFRPRQA